MAILTVNLFNQYSDNYFLSNSTPNNILNAGVRKVLPNIINNVETSLNAMLNGRLYQTFSPNGQITFKDTTQQTTLYSVLTECVLYRIQTGEYINLHNQYTGNVNGTNNFSTDNSNVIGLRNDIRDKLILLGLYQSGSFTQATLPTIPDNSNNNVLTQGMLFKIVQALQNANINFNGTISLPSNTIIGQDGPISSIYQTLQEFAQILANYMSPITPIPLPSNKIVYSDCVINIENNNGDWTATVLLGRASPLNFSVDVVSTTNGFMVHLTTSVNNGVCFGLYPSNNGNSTTWFTNLDSCYLIPYGNPNPIPSSSEWQVNTAFPSWQYLFNGNISMNFLIPNATGFTEYLLFLQAWGVIPND